jgi:hypothetical protein
MMRPFDASAELSNLRLRGLFLQNESAKIENIWIGFEKE